MVEEMPRYLRCRHLELETFEAGCWSDALRALALTPTPPERPRTDGADVAAAMIVDRLSAP